YYQISAVLNGVESARSAEVHATDAPPGPVSVRAASSPASFGIVAAWDPGYGLHWFSRGLQYMTYNVYRSETPGGEGNVPYRSAIEPDDPSGAGSDYKYHGSPFEFSDYGYLDDR